MSAQRSLLMRYQSRRPCYCYLYSKEVEILNLETRQKLFWASGSDLAYIGYFTLSHRYLVIVSIETDNIGFVFILAAWDINRSRKLRTKRKPDSRRPVSDPLALTMEDLCKISGMTVSGSQMLSTSVKKPSRATNKLEHVSTSSKCPSRLNATNASPIMIS
ncbi:hypothetical protein VTN49DRAFT_7266 [Thermomyces lanuginosus]|uniref:uncharacterized protein n=1 Tax=Thermomyces lanuginosus TaxID=5541 RepID=UPI0037435E82